MALSVSRFDRTARLAAALRQRVAASACEAEASAPQTLRGGER